MTTATTEHQVMIAAKFYEARRALKSLNPEGYAAKVRPWREVIRAAADANHDGNEMMACYDLLKTTHDGMVQVVLLAATVDEIEGA